MEYKLEKALLLIEELQKYVFRGKKKKNKDDEDNDNIGKDGDNGGGTDGHKKRDKSSYRRPVPQENDITAEEIHDIKNCPACGAPLTKLKLLEFYEEDILPIKEWFTKLKSVKRIKIMTGYCLKASRQNNFHILHPIFTPSLPDTQSQNFHRSLGYGSNFA